MKLTKSQLKQIIKEAFTNDMADSQWIAQNRLDINDLYSETRKLRAEFQKSIEELTAKLYDSISTGEKPSRFAGDPVVQAPPGRSSGPEELTMSEVKIAKSRLGQIVKEELESLLSERGFGEGEPAKDELSKKRNVYLEGESSDYSTEKLSNGLTRIRKKDSGLTGLYNPDGSYRSGDLRLSKGKVSELTSIKEKKTKVSKAGKKRVSKKTDYLIKSKKTDPDQAYAIAHSMEKRGDLKKGGKHSVK